MTFAERRPRLVAALILVSVGVAGGAWIALGPASVLARFGLLEVVALVVEFSITRVQGSRLAAASAAIMAVLAIDAAARRAGTGSPPSIRRDVIAAGAAALLLYVPACLALWVGAIAGWVLGLQQSVAPFLHRAAGALHWTDLLAGLATSLAYALVVGAGLHLGRRLWSSNERSLRAKLAVATAAIACVWSADGALRASLDPPNPAVQTSGAAAR